MHSVLYTSYTCLSALFTGTLRRGNVNLSFIIDNLRRTGLCLIGLALTVSIATGEESDSLKAYRTRLSVFPFAYYTPETQLALGGGGIVTFYTANDSLLRPSKLGVSGDYSTNGQYKVGLNPELYFFQNKYFFSLKINYGESKNKFYGIGPETPTIDEVGYNVRTYGLLLSGQLPSVFVLSTRGGIVYDLRQTDITKSSDNRYLSAGGVPGEKGGLTSGLGLVQVWDDRDNLFFPTSGNFDQMKFVVYSRDLGSDYSFLRFTWDVRSYRPLAENHILAVQFLTSIMTGNPPFYELSALGGQNTMRGYFYGRYRDKDYIAAQAEYRTFVWNRIGFVVFGGGGAVADDVTHFRSKNVQSSFGGGIRYKFNVAEQINLRADIGIGKGSTGIYFGIEEAF